MAIQERNSHRLKCDWSEEMGKWWCSKTCQGDTVERIERWGKPGLESWLGLCSHRVGLILQSGKNISWLLGQRATNNQ